MFSSIVNFYNYSITFFESQQLSTPKSDFKNLQVLSTKTSFGVSTDSANIYANITVVGVTSDIVGQNSNLFYLVKSVPGDLILPQKQLIYCYAKDNSFTNYYSVVQINKSDFMNQTDGQVYFSLQSNVSVSLSTPLNLGVFNTNVVPISSVGLGQSSFLSSINISSLSINEFENSIFTLDIFGDEIKISELSKNKILYNSQYNFVIPIKQIEVNDINCILSHGGRQLNCPSKTLVLIEDKFVLAELSPYFKQYTLEKSILLESKNNDSYILNGFEIINPFFIKPLSIKKLPEYKIFINNAVSINGKQFSSIIFGGYSWIELNYIVDSFELVSIYINSKFTRATITIISDQNVFVEQNHNYYFIGGKQIFDFNLEKEKIIKIKSNSEFKIIDFVGKYV
jgi:hypothetical protein